MKFSLAWFTSLIDRFSKGSEKDEKLQTYKSKLIGNVMTVIMKDGTTFTEFNVSKKDYEERIKLTDVQMVNYFNPPQNIENADSVMEKKMREIDTDANLLTDVFVSSGEVIRDGDSFYFLDKKKKPIKRSIPPLLFSHILEVVRNHFEEGGDEPPVFHKEKFTQDPKYLSYKRFFMWCCANPRAEVADMLYDFLDRNKFRLTKHGLFVALRNVVKVESEEERVSEFISEIYNKVKAIWKKPAKRFTVYRDEDGELDFCINSKVSSPGFQAKNHIVLGNLQELYDGLPEREDNRYTDDWTRTFDIRIGKLVRMNPEDCAWSTADCASAGLHFTANEIHYVNCGETSLVILINPMKVVGIGSAKGRCYEYLPIMSVQRSEATELLANLDFDTLELDDSYVAKDLEEIEKTIPYLYSTEYKKYDFNVPQVDKQDIESISRNLKAMKDDLKKRIQVIV